MAPRRRSGISALLTSVLLVAAACSPDGTSEAIGEDPVLEATTTTVSTVTPTITTLPPNTTAAPNTDLTTEGSADFGASVRVPEGTGPFPTVVLVHGGGWVTGDPSAMSELAMSLSEEGFLTVNTRYKLSAQEAAFPDAVDDVACAVRYAAAHPASNGSVTIVGHSAGAHLSALVALTGDRYGEECPFPGSGLPDRLVGLAGPYDVERLGLAVLPFFGGGPNVEPEAWVTGNPQGLAGENVELTSLILYGENDALVDASFAIDFHQALTEAGSESTLELIEGARHMDLRDPEWVSDLIVVWLER